MMSSTAASFLLLLFVACLSLAHSAILTFPNLHPDSFSSLSAPPNSSIANFTISLLGHPWLHSGPTTFHALNRTFTTSDSSLLPHSTTNTTGSDSIGPYQRFSFLWIPNPSLTSSLLQWETAFRVYTSSPSSGAVVFEQRWVTGAEGVSVGDKDKVLSAFPSFLIGGHDIEPQGYLQWAGTFAFTHTKVGAWNSNGSLPTLESGERSGPFVLFDEQAELASMISPLSSFMSTSIVQDGGVVSVGVVGSMRSIPAGWSVETILYFTDDGVNACVEQWGDVMLAKYNKVRSDAYDEFTVQYLGYNTDNGAYFYYNTEPGKNYEETMLDVQSYWQSLDLPFRFVWLDSWFYFKGQNGGTKNWTAMPSIFPSGLPDFHNQLRLPIIAHNRWWSAEVDYATQNGGQYNFIVEGNSSGWAVPIDQRFWDDLFFNASQWGLKVYQQDWLYNEFETVVALTEELDLGRQWLSQMASGAAKAGVSIMYCMPSPRHVLQSIELPAVKQVRASDDYIPGNTAWNNWEVALTSLLEWSLGLAPSKDDFWTTTNQPGNPKKPSAHEPDPLLQSLIATLSTGQVTPSDGIGYMSADVVRRSIRADGLILKPDKPAFFPDSLYAERAFADEPSDDYVVTTSSTHGEWQWGIQLVVNSDESNTTVLLHDAISSSHPDWWVVEYDRDRLYPTSVRGVGLMSPLPVPVLGSWLLASFGPFMASGEWGVSVGLLGETDKWVTMSKQRVRGLRVDGGEVEVGLVGGEGEVVQAWYIVRNDTDITYQMVYGGCGLGQTGTATLLIQFNNATSWSCGEGTVVPTPPPSERKEEVRVASE